MDFLERAGFLLGFGTLLGGVAAAFWAAREKGYKELLRTENQAYKDSHERLYDENTRLKEEKAAAEARAKVFEDSVTQRPSIEKLVETISQQHTETTSKLADVATILASLVDNATAPRRRSKK